MRKYLIYILLPLTLGAIPYIFLRSNPPVFVVMIESLLSRLLGLSVTLSRYIALDPNWRWLTDQLPDGMWAFSLCSFLIFSTQKQSRVTKATYFLAGVGIALTLELTVGTFDWLDVFAIAVGFISAFILLGSRPPLGESQ